MAGMIKIQPIEYEKLLPCLEKDLVNCVYIYMNLINGEKENADMEVWTQDIEGKTETILMRYYETFRIYCRKDEISLDAVVALIGQYRPKMIAGQESVIQVLSRDLGESYRAEYGSIYEIDSKKRLRNRYTGVLAQESDAEDIANLIMTEEGLGSHYSLMRLKEQIRNRIRTGTGRSYIIRENGQVVAHTATYAEVDSCAIVSGTVVHPDYRDKGCYPVISSYIAKKLKEENKKAYTFAVEPRMIQYHDRMDIECGKYGRLILQE